MKKLSLILILCIVLSTFTGCIPLNPFDKTADTATEELPPEDKKEVEEPKDKEKVSKPKENKGARTIDITEGLAEDGLSFDYDYDMDFDGSKEKIHIEAEGFETWGDSTDDNLKVTLGEYTGDFEIWEGTIKKVYACDLDAKDGLMELAIFTNEVSDDPRVRILKYDSDLTPAMFRFEDFEGNIRIDDCNWIGYAFTYYLNVLGDYVFTLEEQTQSAGMWSVYRTYELKDGAYEVIPETNREVLHNFVEESYGSFGPVVPEELEKWKEGHYIKAYVEYPGDGITLYPGDYFKVVLDDDNHNIMVEKETGEKGWINISYENPLRDKLNMNYFYLAG